MSYPNLPPVNTPISLQDDVKLVQLTVVVTGAAMPLSVSPGFSADGRA